MDKPQAMLILLVKNARDGQLKLRDLTRAVRRQWFIDLLTEHHFNQCAAARAEGMHRNSLGRDLSDLGIDIAKLRADHVAQKKPVSPERPPMMAAARA